MENEIRSQKLLKPGMRKPFQTTGFIYKVLNAAELQIEEQLKELKKLRTENLRLLKISKRNVDCRKLKYEKRKKY